MKFGHSQAMLAKLDEYEPPPLDEAVRAGLEKFVIRRRAGLGD